MNIKYKYKKAGNFYRPIIDITLKQDKIEFGYFALVDSGADFCIFHTGIASLLKIDINKLKKDTFSGIGKGKKLTSYLGAIEIGVKNYFYNTPVFFSDEISTNSYGVLGQVGFFDRFKVNFNYKNKTIFVKH